MYENYIGQCKAILLQCEKEYGQMINVRFYQEIVIPFFNVKHGQDAAVALTRSGANKLLRKVWEAFITRRDRIVAKEHAKTIQNQKSLIFNSIQLNCQPGNKLTTELTKNWRVLMLRLKA